MDADPKAVVYLDNQPYGVKSYQRGTTTDLISRFSTSAAGETDLDLLKVLSQTSFRGGMFERNFNDGETVNSIVNAYYNDLDSFLYFTPALHRFGSGTNAMNFAGVSAWCYLNGFVYIACQNEAPANGNSLMKFNANTGATTAISLPNAIASSGCPIQDLVVHKGNIFILGDSYQAGGEFPVHRYDGGTTFTQLSGGYTKGVSWRNTLYVIDTDGSINVATNELSATWSLTVAKVAGQPGAYYNLDRVHDVSIFNNAMYIAKADGLFRYDGVDIATVFDYSNNVTRTNFQYVAVFNGRYYYNIGSKLYEFDGTTVTLLQDFTAGYQIRAIAAGTDRLWITAQIQAGVPAVVNDKDGFYPYNTYAQHIFCYNGTGFFEYKSLYGGDGDYLNGIIVTPVPVETKIWFVYPNGYLNASLDTRSSGMYYHYIDLSTEFSNSDLTSDTFTIVSGDIDNGYTSVPKVLNGIAIDYDGFEAGKSNLKVEAQYFYDGTWSDFTEIWNTQNVGHYGISRDYALHDQSAYGNPNLPTYASVYIRMRFRITGSISTGVTLANVPRLKNLTMRYTLQPRMRRQWQLSLIINGLDNRNLNTGTLDDKDDDRHNNEIRKQLYDAYKNKIPLLFYDVDFSHVSNVSPLKIKGTSLFDAGDILAFANSSDLRWINRRIGSAVYDEVNDITSLSFDPYGYRIGLDGAPNGTPLTLNYQVRRSHAVYITQITNDHLILDPNTMNDKNGYSDLPGDIVIKLVEL